MCVTSKPTCFWFITERVVGYFKVWKLTAGGVLAGLILAMGDCLGPSFECFPYTKWSEVKVTQSYPTVCNPMDCTVHGILQARILEWVAFPFSRGYSQPRDCTQVSRIGGGFLTSWATRAAHIQKSGSNACAQLVDREEYLHFLAF